MITPRIVTTNTIVTAAPQPSTLQQSAAIISLGGTTLATGSYQYLSVPGQLTPILGAGGNHLEVSNAVQSFFAQGNAIGCYVLELGTEGTPGANIPALLSFINAQMAQPFYLYITPTEWDGLAGGVTAFAITNPGSGYPGPTANVTFSPPGTGVTATGYAVIANGQVVNIIITNPGSGYSTAPSVTIAAPPAPGITATATASIGSPLKGMASAFASPNGKTYFLVQTTSANLASYAGTKSILAVVPAPTALATEYPAAAIAYDIVVQNPSAATMAQPLGYQYVYGITPWQITATNMTTITNVMTAYGNVILTGAEGGISNACIRNGTTMDGQQFMWWYAVDWFQIQADRLLSAAIINGSNSQPPLIYNQAGVNTLLAVAQNAANASVAFGLNLSATVTATPFSTYILQNPGDHNAGIYRGFQATVLPNTGFLAITFNINAVQF